MALTLCRNCRLPVNDAVHRCPQCGVMMSTATETLSRQAPFAAAIALVATVALLARRYA